MTKIVLIPDSFKGSINASDVCDIMEASILKFIPDAEVKKIPISDGGEGSVKSLLSANGGRLFETEISGPYLEKLVASYGILSNNTVVIETAAAIGLPLVGDNKIAKKATSFGVGELIRRALDHNPAKIIVGLGGSCTNDGGAGLAAALGVQFINGGGKEFLPKGEDLHEIDRINVETMDPRLKKTEIICMCDVDNLLLGETGATYYYGPQKGASLADLELMERGMAHYSQVITRDIGVDVTNLRGGGAAGGIGAGMHAFFNAQLLSGIEIILESFDVDKQLIDTDLIFTGEGRIDSQSLRGKAIFGVAGLAKKKGIPVIAVVGDVGDGVDPIYTAGITSIFSINQRAIPYEEARLRSKQDLSFTMDNIIRFMNRNQKSK